MGKGLHKVFKAVVNELSQALPILGESGSEVYYFILEPRNFAEVTRLSEDISKPWIKLNMKDIKNLMNNMDDPEKGEPMNPCIDVYKAKLQSDGIPDKFKLISLVRGDLQNEDSIGDTWSTTASMRTL